MSTFERISIWRISLHANLSLNSSQGEGGEVREEGEGGERGGEGMWWGVGGSVGRGVGARGRKM